MAPFLVGSGSHECVSVRRSTLHIYCDCWDAATWHCQRACVDVGPKAYQKMASMVLTIKLDRNWSSFQLANSAPPLSVTDSAIAPSARMNISSASTGDFCYHFRYW